ncbi:MAG: universal stress protein [Pseudoleptotrichia goodfellowii]|nr:universal stress protein [Pseudoleptotrichia goodfellowii]
MTETMVKMYVINKVGELAKTAIYRSEIVNAGKAGFEKFEAATNNFWDKAEEYILKEKEIDRKWIPDVIENLGEEAIHKAIKVLRVELDPKKLVQDIFNIEKKENPTVL